MLATYKLVPRHQFFYHILSCFVNPYHTLSLSLSHRLEAKLFLFGNCKISSQSPNFLSHLIMPCHTLSHLIPQVGSKTIFILQLQNQFPGPNFFYHILSHLLTPYLTLSPKQERNHFPLGILKLVPRIMFLLHIALGIENSFPIVLRE